MELPPFFSNFFSCRSPAPSANRPWQRKGLASVATLFGRGAFGAALATTDDPSTAFKICTTAFNPLLSCCQGGVMGATLSVNLSWWLLSLAMFAYVLFKVFSSDSTRCTEFFNSWKRIDGYYISSRVPNGFFIYAQALC